MGKKIKKTKTDKNVGEKMKKVIETVFLKDRRLTVSIGTAADFGKAKIGLSLSENVREKTDPMELADELYDILVEKLEDKFDDLCEKIGLDEDSSVDDEDDNEDSSVDDDEDDDEDDDDEDDEDDDEDDVTEEEILKMKKADIIKLIKDEELEINPNEYKKIGELRAAVIDALFDDEDDEDDDWDSDDDDDWGDDD